MEEKFTLEEIRKYLITQDSLGDVMYNLKAENIRQANPKAYEPYGDDCAFFDPAQGRGLCMSPDSEFITCQGPCKYFCINNQS
jgi:hypothetical protein